MRARSADSFLDRHAWAVMLAEAEGITGLAPGACIGIVAREVARTERGDMLLYRAGNPHPSVCRARFVGFSACEADLLFVVDDEAAATLDRAGSAGAMVELRRQVRRGGVVLYFLKCEGSLVRLGYERFLDSLGLTVMGACR